MTLEKTPFCGQFNCAVVCLTGSSGVASANATPSSPVTIATIRAVR